MTMSIDVSVRELRNHTKQVVERIEDGTTMYLTKNGERIATIAPLRPATWADHVDDVLAIGRDDSGPYDSGLADVLADDDTQSAAFDDDHLGSVR
jgi:prevent-host-death family protein